MTRRLYRLYFSEPPPMDIWCDALLPHDDLAALQRPTPPPVLEASIDRRARIDSEPTRPMVIDPALQSTSQGHHQQQHHHHRFHSQRKVPTVIKKELPDENSPLRKRGRSPTGDTTSTPLRRSPGPTASALTCCRGRSCRSRQDLPTSPLCSRLCRWQHMPGLGCHLKKKH